ncbi:hypothetical protein [Litorisediminicola beolgyonensis]|uniref:Hedgehog/Intein (Hint) domain-containing protein n=1 Tax=Litorisediminicola beolgyonensis TaxID=1173614 RepID=A0ABW3ZNX4_9RHOB
MFWNRRNSGSIALGPDGQANHLLALVSGQSRDGTLSSKTRIAPGFMLNSDPALGLSGRYGSPEGRLLEVDAEMSGPGDWIALHLDFHAGDLSEMGVLGFALRGVAPEMILLRACLRSGTPEGFEDCFFDKHILLHPEESTHLDALALPYRDRLPVTAPWRQLVIFLPTETFRLSIADLRVFLV